MTDCGEPISKEEIDRLLACEDALRSLACWLSAGGYNAPTVDPKIFEEKIRWGVDYAIETALKMSKICIIQLTLEELWQLRDRSVEMTGQYELAIQLLFARKNGLLLTDEQNADLDTFLTSSSKE